MSESERRHGYAYNRVLIETERILDPQFADAVVFLSGAQIEMLRNVTQYLNRRETYMTEQFLGYYLAPTTAEYDDILEIVADLEETLMGNPNTIWGYKDRWTQYRGLTKSGNGDHMFEVTTVPAGYVYVLNGVMSSNEDTVVTQEHNLHDGTREYPLSIGVAIDADTWYITSRLEYPLKEGDSIRVTFKSALDGDVIRAQCWGYMMKVPE